MLYVGMYIQKKMPGSTFEERKLISAKINLCICLAIHIVDSGYTPCK